MIRGRGVIYDYACVNYFYFSVFMFFLLIAGAVVLLMFLSSKIEDKIKNKKLASKLFSWLIVILVIGVIIAAATDKIPVFTELIGVD